MFRVKIALLIVLLSGLVLVSLGLYSLSVMKQVRMDRIDREIMALGEGHLAVNPPPDYWKNFESSLRFMYGGEPSKDLIVQIRGPGNKVLFQSSRWPPEMSEDDFPAFDRTMDTHPPPAGIRGSRRGPPPEAYKACEGLRTGQPSEFVGPRGQTVTGTCEEHNGILVMRPANPRDDLQGPPPGRQSNSPVSNPFIPERPGMHRPHIKKPYFATIRTSSGVWRTGIMGNGRVTMLIGMNLAGFYEDTDRFRRAFLLTVPMTLLLLGAGGWLIARRALKPVALITRTAEGITARDLGHRVPPVSSDSDLSRLVLVINGMLDRLEKSFGQAVRFSADAAHELQTPLAILQGELDDAVQHAPIGSEEQRRYNGLLEEVQRLKVIVQKLLVLARADTGRLNLRFEPMDLSAAIEAAAEDAGSMAPHLRIEKQIPPGVIVKADPDLIGQAVRNLVSNAVKFNRENGLIRFRLVVRDNRAHVTVSNTGMPIPDQDRGRIFDRFYRVDRSRSKTIDGSGLGLSLAREIVHAHRGDLRLDPDSGDMISFTLSLPCSSC